MKHITYQSLWIPHAPIVKARQSGFTLVEMAIVLVIIGLLLSGVLKGQELVVQARVKSVINDFNSVTAAYYTYFDRYHRIPGDDATVAARGWDAAAIGDGNGTLGTAGTGFNATTGENAIMWWQLRLAGIVNGATADLATGGAPPVNSVGGVTGVQDGGAFTATAGTTGTVVCTSNVPGRLARLVDFAIDDGVSHTGTVQFGASVTAAAVANASINDGSTYIVCRKL